MDSTHTSAIIPEVVDELPEELLSTDLITTVQKQKLDKAGVRALLDKLPSEFDLAAVKTKALAIVITDASQKDKITEARALRLSAKNERVRRKNFKDALKRPILDISQAVDEWHREGEAALEEIESHCKEQEAFVERQEAKRIKELGESRQKQLSEFNHVESVPGLGSLSNAHFDLILAGAKAKHEADEALRIQKEKDDREREEREKALREENERLMLEKVEIERKAREAEETARKEREAIEAREKAAQEELRKQIEEAEQKERDRIAAEEAEKARIADEKAKAAAAPDAEKLIAFADAVLALELPSVVAPEAQTIVERINNARNVWTDKIKAEAKEMRYADVPF